MMLLVIVVTLLKAMRVHKDVTDALIFLIPPMHLYRQLRGAYGLSRAGALVHLLFVLVSAVLVLGIFVALLLLVGALG